MLDVHAPHKPLHGVWEFFLHLFTISIGLLIATQIESCVERHHHAHETGEASGTLKGKEAVGCYWRKGLALFPDLHFDWIATTVGINSIAIHFQGAGGRLVIEVFHCGPDGKVLRAFAHYA